ncbi:hypothetical protein Baya_0854 [Bagarius yarrelli]|uniref:Uncharacterized protein n=1 Tax=Bagarius yarrelli TaxID=175774 RepID=A0A556TJG7_BAGYA|nr:hypothetical protein Baya_0854 [Bagarius yarrelli]
MRYAGKRCKHKLAKLLRSEETALNETGRSSAAAAVHSSLSSSINRKKRLNQTGHSRDLQGSSSWSSQSACLGAVLWA